MHDLFLFECFVTHVFIYVGGSFLSGVLVLILTDNKQLLRIFLKNICGP